MSAFQLQGLADWLPIKNVRTLVPQIRTVEGEPLSLSNCWTLACNFCCTPATATRWHARHSLHHPHVGLGCVARQGKLLYMPALVLSIACYASQLPAVQIATWVKKQFALKPALARAR